MTGDSISCHAECILQKGKRCSHSTNGWYTAGLRSIQLAVAILVPRAWNAEGIDHQVATNGAHARSRSKDVPSSTWPEDSEGLHPRIHRYDKTDAFGAREAFAMNGWPDVGK